jgi:hypothetical protein
MDTLEVGISGYLQFDQLGQLKMLTASWSGDDKLISSVTYDIYSHDGEKYTDLNI